MKVAKLIDALRRLPPGAEVYGDDGASMVTEVEVIDGAVVISCETDRQRKARERIGEAS